MITDARYDLLLEVERLREENRRWREERDEALALLEDAPTHADVDAAMFDNNNLRAENARLRAALAPVLAVYEKFKHLDELLSDERWFNSESEFDFQRHILYDLWQAVKAAARAAALVTGAGDG